MGAWEYPLWGLGGGIAAEAVRWYNIRYELYKGRPLWATGGGYWVITGVMTLIGAGLVYMHQSSGVEMNPVLAANLGASAPTILSTLLKTAPMAQDVEPQAPLGSPGGRTGPEPGGDPSSDQS